MKRQIDEEQWVIYTNDRGSGSAGVSDVDDVSIIENYLHFAKTGDNIYVPNCHDMYYKPSEDFDDEDNDIINEILEYDGEYIDREEILGFVVCQEFYDMEYTFYLAHIKG